MVKYGEVSKGQRKIYVVGEDGEEREYSLPRGTHINVQEGERVEAGDPLMDGPPQARTTFWMFTAQGRRNVW